MQLHVVNGTWTACHHQGAGSGQRDGVERAREDHPWTDFEEPPIAGI